jgi:holin-like protein
MDTNLGKSELIEARGELIVGLVQILFFQGLGELISKFVLPAIPGPMFGLVLLLVFLTVRGRVNPSLSFVAGAFSQHLGILFVPAAVGVVLFLPQLRHHFFGLLVALVLSAALSMAATALVLKFLSPGSESEL